MYLQILSWIAQKGKKHPSLLDDECFPLFIDCLFNKEPYKELHVNTRTKCLYVKPYFRQFFSITSFLLRLDSKPKSHSLPLNLFSQKRSLKIDNKYYSLIFFKASSSAITVTSLCCLKIEAGNSSEISLLPNSLARASAFFLPETMWFGPCNDFTKLLCLIFFELVLAFFFPLLYKILAVFYYGIKNINKNFVEYFIFNVRIGASLFPFLCILLPGIFIEANIRKISKCIN